MNQIEELLKRVLTSLLVDMVISGARGGGDFIKIKVRPVMIRDSLYFQVSRYTDKQFFHENMTAEDALETLSGWILHDFRQAQIRMQDEMVTVLVSKQGKATIIMTFDIHGTEELNRITDKIRQIEGVLDIQRTTG